MANTVIQVKKSAVSGNTPTSLANGELAINYADGKLYYRSSVGGINYITNQQTFSSIVVNNSVILAGSPTDILTITPNNNIKITTDTTGKKFYIDVANSIGLSSNIYANNIIANTQFFAGIATYSSTPLPNLIAQFTGNSTTYVQVNAQNISPNGSADYVVTGDVGDDNTFYIDMGFQGSGQDYGAIKRTDGYLYVQGNTGQVGGNLIIGTTSSTPGQMTKIIAGGYQDSNVVVTFDVANTKVLNNLVTVGTISGPTIANLQSQINNISSTGGGNNFGTISTSGYPSLIANSTNTNLTFVAQTGIAIGLNPNNSTISIATNTFGASNLAVDFGVVTDILGSVTFDYGYVS